MSERDDLASIVAFQRQRDALAAPVRDVQLSLVEGMERSVGPQVRSVQLGNNSDLIAAVAPLYLAGRVLDVTYGRGMWWRRYRPASLTHHDLATDGVDFRALPYPNQAFDAVCFDPPYVPRHGKADATAQRDQDFRDRYGLDTSRSWNEMRDLVLEGLAECARVSGRWVLVKCCDFTNGRRFELMHARVLTEGERLGLRPHDLVILHSGPGPGGSQIKRPLRARRAHSYLLVFDTRPFHRLVRGEDGDDARAGEPGVLR